MWNLPILVGDEEVFGICKTGTAYEEGPIDGRRLVYAGTT